VDGVVLCKTLSAPLTPAAFKASAGLAEHLDIYVAPSIKSAVQDLKQAGYNMYMAVLGGKDATCVEYKKPTCLVIGNEAIGIAKDVVSMGHSITLPQSTPDISYNASVAAGILLFLISSKAEMLR
jgi:23S rRNA (guanosine2251-2'-O)-methyltransferase